MNEHNLTLNFILLLIFSIIIFSITLTLIIFDIIALIQPVINCNGSNLWYYLLVSIIITILSFLHNICMHKETEIGIANSILYFCGCSGMLIWGGYELFIIPCSTNKILYKVSLANWILLSIYNILFVYLIYYCFLKKQIITKSNFIQTPIKKDPNIEFFPNSSDQKV